MTAPDAEDLAELAGRIAPTLVGLTRADAARRVSAADDRLVVRFVEPGQAVTLEFRYGRITAAVRDGVVLRANAG